MKKNEYVFGFIERQLRVIINRSLIKEQPVTLERMNESHQHFSI